MEIASGVYPLADRGRSGSRNWWYSSQRCCMLSGYSSKQDHDLLHESGASFSWETHQRMGTSSPTGTAARYGSQNQRNSPVSVLLPRSTHLKGVHQPLSDPTSLS